MLIPIVFSVAVLLQAQAPAAQPPHPPERAAKANAALQLQVMLDRAGFSPGAIDGRMGANTRKALEQFHKQGHQDATAVPAVTQYHITREDAAGPFGAIPSDMMEQSKLPALGYASVLELLAERFHSVPALLQRLNPQAKFAAGEDITVPNVEAMVPPAPAPAVPAQKPPEQVQGARDEVRPERSQRRRAGGMQAASRGAGVPDDSRARTEWSQRRSAGGMQAASRGAGVPDDSRKAAVVTVVKRTSGLTVTDAGGRVLFYAPVTTGSEHDPLPIGEWKVRGVQFSPTFRYNPDLFWDADPTHSKATIPAGPNNPVGLVWIDLSKEHYGLHGTPEPSTVGKAQSHGCVRLTNWDALKLAGMVKPGTRVVFTE